MFDRTFDHAHPQAWRGNGLDVSKNMAEKITEPVYAAIAAGHTFSSPGPTTPVSAATPGPGAAAGDTCPTCGGAPGPGKTGRCAACVEEEWAKLRSEMGEEWYQRHRHREGD